MKLFNLIAAVTALTAREEARGKRRDEVRNDKRLNEEEAKVRWFLDPCYSMT